MAKKREPDITLSQVHSHLMDERNRPPREREMAQMMKTVLPMMLGAGRAAPTMAGKATPKAKRKRK
jgi:hypothetical protein